MRFRHPLIRSAVYEGARRGDRLRVHDVWASIAGQDGNPDEAAWHRAAATVVPDEQVAAGRPGTFRRAGGTARRLSETDFTEDLRKIDVPTLVLHGEDDQIVPVKDAAVKSARLIKDAREIYYPGAPHGLTDTHQDQFNADLLAFLRS